MFFGFRAVGVGCRGTHRELLAGAPAGGVQSAGRASSGQISDHKLRFGCQTSDLKC